MSTSKETNSPIGLLFAFCIPFIDGLDELSLEQQLNILNPNNLSSAESREALITNLCAELTDFDEAMQLQSVLETFYFQTISLRNVSPEKWSVNQMALSLFTYFMDRVRRIVDDDEKEYENDRKMTVEMWALISNLKRFCAEKEESMKKLWSEITGNGTATALCASTMVNMICNRYDLKITAKDSISDCVERWVRDDILKRLDIPLSDRKNTQTVSKGSVPKLPMNLQPDSNLTPFALIIMLCSPTGNAMDSETKMDRVIIDKMSALSLKSRLDLFTASSRPSVSSEFLKGVIYTASTMLFSDDAYTIKLDSTKKMTKIKLLFIDGKEEAVTANLTTTLSELYGDVKELSMVFPSLYILCREYVHHCFAFECPPKSP